MSDETPLTILEEITTRWSVIANPMTFVLRYGPAVRSYMAALLPNRHDAEDATQDFLLKTLGRPTVAPNTTVRGRFRDYLKATIRNAAMDHYRRQSRSESTALVDDTIEVVTNNQQADSTWDTEWRQVLIDRCWEQLESIQRSAKGNYAYSILRLTMDDPADDTPGLIVKLSDQCGVVLSSEAFRKQRSRARREFARILVEEVKQTLESATAQNVIDELATLQLLDFVVDYLPERYRSEIKLDKLAKE